MINTIKEMLNQDEYSCIVAKDGVIKHSVSGRGIIPLFNIYMNHVEDLKDSIVGDKVIGKAAGMILLCSGVKSVYAKMISKNGLKLLLDNNIEILYDILVDEIKNNGNTDSCPLEKMLMDVEIPFEGVEKLKSFLNKK